LVPKWSSVWPCHYISVVMVWLLLAGRWRLAVVMVVVWIAVVGVVVGVVVVVLVSSACAAIVGSHHSGRQLALVREEARPMRRTLVLSVCDSLPRIL
jgi:hypothetical protein